MSSKLVDIRSLTVDDIFRAKEERRRRLAKLPFDQKIVIVKKLRAAVKAIRGEKGIFASFLHACPDFADEPIKEWDVVDEWYAKRALDPPPHPFDKRPDIIALTASGRRIGVELKSWINQEQIQEARKQESIEDQILKAVGEQPQNETKNIGFVRLSAKQKRFVQGDAPEFRKQIFALIEEQDNTWLQKPDWEQQLFDPLRDLGSFPILEKYLDSIEIHPRPFFDTGWIQFPNRGGAYSPNDMLATLSKALVDHTNDDRYQCLKEHVGLDESYLLIHYDSNAVAYNTPFEAPNFGFKQVAEFASKVLKSDAGYFDRVFLFQFLAGKEEAYRIVPSN